MEDKQKQKIFSPKFIAILAIIILMGGTLTAWLATQFLKKSSQQDSIKTIPIPTEIKPNINTPKNPDVKIPQTENLEVYWLNDNLDLIPTSISLQKANNKQTSLENLFAVLLAGNTQGNNSTTIPEGTKILALKVEKDGIHLNLSQDFLSGGGSASMIGRLGQIIYTATSMDNNAQVWINIDGQPLTELGGEGLAIEQPMTRIIYDEYFKFDNDN